MANMKDIGFGKSDKQLADAFGVSVSEIKKIKKQITSEITKPAPKKPATAKPKTETMPYKPSGKPKAEVMPYRPESQRGPSANSIPSEISRGKTSPGNQPSMDNKTSRTMSMAKKVATFRAAAGKTMAKPTAKAPAKTTTKAPAKPTKAPVKKKVVQMPSKISPSKMTPAQKAKYLQNPERYDG